MILLTCHFLDFGYFGLHKPKESDNHQLVENLRVSAGKKSTLASTFFWRCSKDKQTSYFHYLGHAWLQHTKMTYQAAENFDVYLHPRFRPFLSRFGSVSP